MNCPKCNTPIKEGKSFCGNCGERISQPPIEATPKKELPSTDSPIESAKEAFFNAPENSKTKSTKKTIIITAIIVAAVAVIAGLGVAAWKFNWFGSSNSTASSASASDDDDKGSSSASKQQDEMQLKVQSFINDDNLSEQEQYAKIEAATLTEFVNSLDFAYNGAKKFVSNSKTQFKVQITDEASSLIDAFGDLISTNNEKSDQWKNILQKLKNVGIELDMKENDTAIGGKVMLSVNDTDIVGAECASKKDGSGTYVRLPEVYDSYFTDDSGQIYSIASDLDKFIDFEIPSGAKDEIGNIIEAALTRVPSVDKSSETISAEGLSQEVTAYSYVLEDQDVINMFVAALEQAKKSDEIKNLVKSFLISEGYSEERADESFDEFIDEGLNNIPISKSNNEYVYKMYVGESGRIVGRSFSVNIDNEVMEYSYLDIEDDSECVKKASVNVYGDGRYAEAAIIANGKNTGRYFTGDVVVKMTNELDGHTENKELFKFKLRDFLFDPYAQVIEGTVLIDIADNEYIVDSLLGDDALNILKSFNFAVDLDINKNKVYTNIDVKFNKFTILTATLDTKYSTDFNPNVSNNAAKPFDPNNLNMENVTRNIEAAGFPSELLFPIHP